MHTVPVTFLDQSAVAKKLLTINGSATQPMYFRISAVVRVQSNASITAALAVGVIGVTYVDAIAAFDMKSAVGVNATQAGNPIKLALVDTDIFAVPTIGGSATIGITDVIIEVWDANINEPTNQGS